MTPVHALRPFWVVHPGTDKGEEAQGHRWEVQAGHALLFACSFCGPDGAKTAQGRKNRRAPGEAAAPIRAPRPRRRRACWGVLR